jgi:ADP-heptose:LPS heptosyltransferase
MTAGARRQARDVLVVELLGGFGDLLLALPAIHALARSHPGARVTVLTFAPGSDLLEADPLVAEVVVARPGPPDEQARQVAKLAARGFDLIVSDSRYGGIPAILADSGAPWVVDDLWRRPPPDQRIDLRFLDLLAADGVIDPGLRRLPPRVALTAAERADGTARVDALLGAGPAPVLLVPEAGMGIKEWGEARFAALGRELVAAGARVLVAAGARPAIAAAVAAAVPGTAVLPRLPLRALAAVAAACAACVAGDTGPARLASAVGTPTVALFGPSWAGRFGLRDDHISLQAPVPCPIRRPANMTEQTCWYSGECGLEGRHSCLDDLTVTDVRRALAGLLVEPHAA